MIKKKNNKKGFTLAELLIVVAIIAVLVAISIPIFTSQRKKAYLATNQANARAAYAAATSDYLVDETSSSGGYYEYNTTTGKATYSAAKPQDSGTITTTSNKISGWTTATEINSKKMGDATYSTWYVQLGSDGTVTGYSCK